MRITLRKSRPVFTSLVLLGVFAGVMVYGPLLSRPMLQRQPSRLRTIPVVKFDMSFFLRIEQLGFGPARELSDLTERWIIYDQQCEL